MLGDILPLLLLLLCCCCAAARCLNCVVRLLLLDCMFFSHDVEGLNNSHHPELEQVIVSCTPVVAVCSSVWEWSEIHSEMLWWWSVQSVIIDMWYWYWYYPNVLAMYGYDIIVVMWHYLVCYYHYIVSWYSVSHRLESNLWLKKRRKTKCNMWRTAMT